MLSLLSRRFIPLKGSLHPTQKSYIAPLEKLLSSLFGNLLSPPPKPGFALAAKPDQLGIQSPFPHWHLLGWQPHLSNKNHFRTGHLSRSSSKQIHKLSSALATKSDQLDI
ncbi:hypothetical protein F511_44663 [Dorcoceras hygrometricum]|uniref:Uncharacterized protein n=1 Tax=Dorcoceras hygrometricum TaxID=472368 RepID=A0A2Z7CD03_9LAMI|nr:hypothetical protein F511_44663 [Dorcoceras hygrometricum]